MSDYIHELFLERQRWRRNDFVFPGGRGRKNTQNVPMVSPYKQIDQLIATSGIKFSPHDLRRTFLSIAEDCFVDEHTRKRLLNHTFTDAHNKHYSVPNPERLREPMQRISARILFLADLSLPLTG
jgi:integrase